MGLEAFAKGLAFPITADIDGLIKGLGQADIELSKVEKAFARGQQVIKQYSLAIGIAMEGAALTIATTTKYAAEMNAKLGVTALTIGSTTEEMRDLALETSDAGFRLDDVVATFGLLGRAGVTSTATIQDLAREFDTLGDSVGESAASVTSSMIPALYAFDIPVTEVGDHMDGIAYLVNNSLVDYSELASVLGSLGTTLHGLGFSLEDVEALLLAMTNAGIPASVAVRKLRTAISDYDSALTKSKDAAKNVITAESRLADSKKSLARLERDYARALEDAGDTSKEVARIELAYNEKMADAKKDLLNLEQEYQDALNEAKDTTEDVAQLDKNRAKEQKREAKALAELEADYAKEKADLEKEARLNPLDWSGNAEKVADLEERYAERRKELNESAAESLEEYNDRLAEIQDTSKAVADVEKRYAKQRESIQESVTEATEDYNKELAEARDTTEAVARVQEAYADRFEDTNAAIAEQIKELQTLREEAAKPAPTKADVVTSLGVSDTDFTTAQQKILTDSAGAAQKYADANEKAITAADKLASALEKLASQAGTAAQPVDGLSSALAIGGPLVVGLAQLPDLVKAFGLAWEWITPLLTGAGEVLSGSLFAGIAAGIALGLAGVWVLLKTGVLDYVSKLGQIFGALAPQWVKDLLVIITSPMASLGAGIIALVSGNFNQIGENMAKPFEWAAEAIGRIVDGIVSTMKGGVNIAIDAINKMVRAMNSLSWDVPDWVPWVGGETFGFNIPEIPRLASGGIVTQPTIAMIGEAGPEAVVPLTGSGAGAAGISCTFTGPITVRNDEDIPRIAREMGTFVMTEMRRNS